MGSVPTETETSTQDTHPPTSPPPTTLTCLAARHLHTIATAELPNEVKRKAGLCLLDYIGAAISGLSVPWAPALLRYAESRRGAPEAHLWGSRVPVSVETAAFTNAALGHSVIRDDMHLAAGSHIGVMVISAALAQAQRDRWPGAQLVRGIVGGYEMAVCLGVAVRQGGTFNPHFRPSGINGAFGAASTGIAATEGLEEDVAVHALGFAANMASGLNEWPWAGGMEIYTHMGQASRSGIVSLDLAKAGMRSSDTVLEGRDGLFEAYGAGAEGARVFERSMERVELGMGIMGVCFKPVAGCNMIQTPIALAMEVGKKIGGRVGDVEKVVVTTTTPSRDYPGCNNIGPFDSVQQTKMSLQYGVSSALLYGRVDEETYLHFNSTKIRRLISRCKIETDPDYDRSFTRGLQPARIEVRLTDGDVCRAALGDVPWLQEEGVITRFLREADAVLAPDVAEEVVRLADTLWELEDCSLLFKAFASARVTGGT